MMMKPQILLLSGMCLLTAQAYAGLFDDEEARRQIQRTEGRVTVLEEVAKQQVETVRQLSENLKQQSEIIRQINENIKQQSEAVKQLTDGGKQLTRSTFDLQTQLETQGTEVRNLRGQNEELIHTLRDTEKRQKDFYIDLDTRLRRMEAAEAARLAAPPPAPVPVPVAAAPVEKTVEAPVAPPDELVIEDRAYEAARTPYRTGDYPKAVNAYAEFLKNYPDSVHAPNAQYEMGNAYFELKDWQKALLAYQALLNKYSYSPKASDAMLNMAESQLQLKAIVNGKKTLMQVIAKYPSSEAAGLAKKRLATLK
ncbi:MAG: tol-pal system protein YbgF [Pseudomonadota bacterium]